MARQRDPLPGSMLEPPRTASILEETATVTRIEQQRPASVVVTAQRRQRQTSRFWGQSPTESVESRLRWARRESWLLRAIHQIRPPTHSMTIKWSQPVTTRSIKEFDKKMSRSLREHSERFGIELRFYSVKEINARDLVHAHLLIRTNLETGALTALFHDRCQRFSGSRASVTYCEPIRQTMAASLYTVKNLVAVRSGEKNLPLFEPGLVRLRTQSRYLEPWRVGDLRDRGRSLWLMEARRYRNASRRLPTFDSFTSTLWEQCSVLTIGVDSITALETDTTIE